MRIVLALVCAAGWQYAGAAIITVSGTLFDVTYDNAQLDPLSGQFSLFGAPTISGSNIVFKPNNLFAQSAAGGLVNVPATFNLMIVPKAGSQLQVNGLTLTELGDLTLRQPGSYVNVGGQLIAYDAANFASYTASNLNLLSPTNSANTVTAPPNVQNASWSAQAAISAAANPSPFANSNGFNVILENQLQAFAPTSDPASFAFIQKKVAGDTVTLTVVTTPIPASALLLASGLLGLVGITVRNRRGVLARLSSSGLAAA
jgi:hypothetical protein